MSSKIEPQKILFKINDISNNSNRREMSFRLQNNRKIQFTLYCRPNCNLPDHDGKFTLVHLYLASSDKPRVLVQYRLSIVNTLEKNVHAHEGEETFVTNTNSLKYGGLYKIDQSFLLDRSNRLIGYEYLSIWDDKVGKTASKRVEKLTICCEIKEIGMNSNLVQNPNSFIQNFQDLLESGNYSDAVLFVGGKELKVHKNILAARSKVFCAMFEHDCEEKKQNRVEITDIQLDVCEELLRYIYTAKIESMDKLAVELLVASDKYQLEELKNGCERYLIKNLSIETIADILLLADLHNATVLKSKCVDFISENAKKVQSTSGWNMLTTKADLIMEIFLKQTEKHELLKNPIVLVDEEKGYRYEQNFSNFSDYQLKIEFGALIEDEKFSDAFLVVNGDELRVHKNILSVRSKIFASIFEENSKTELPDSNIESCKQLLRYLYADGDFNWGNFTLENKYASDLLVLSEKYQLSGLKSISEQKLSQELTIESISSTLLLADKHNASYLKSKCIEYITENCRKVTQTEEWKSMAKAKPELVVQLYEHIAAKQWD